MKKLSLPVLVALTAGPALVVGVGIWFLAGLVPECMPDLHESVPSPDGTTMLVTFGLECGTTGANSHAAIHPATESFSQENAQVFFAADGRHDLAPAWSEAGAIEIDAPAGATVHRQLDTVGEIPVSYR